MISSDLKEGMMLTFNYYAIPLVGKIMKISTSGTHYSGPINMQIYRLDMEVGAFFYANWHFEEMTNVIEIDEMQFKLMTY